MLAGIVPPVSGTAEPVGGDQGAVEDGVGQPGDAHHRLRESGRGGGQQVDSLPDVAPRGGGTDPEPAANRAGVSPLGRCANASSACRAGSSRRHRDRRACRWTRMSWARWVRVRVDKLIDDG